MYLEYHTKAVIAYNRAFWNDTLGYYTDWIDINKEPHAHMYNDHNLLAVSET
jgi:hypothetical protein